MKWLTRTSHRDEEFSQYTFSFFEVGDCAFFEFGIARVKGEWATVAFVLWRFGFTASLAPTSTWGAGWRKALRLDLGRLSFSASYSAR